jgi:hypothetical protein
MIFKYRHIILLTLLTLGVTAVFGQTGAPPGGPAGGGPPCWPPPCVPIDGGVSFLLAIGAAYGAKKAYQGIKEEN